MICNAMKMRKTYILLAFLLCFVGAKAQHAYHSVLSEHTWYKMTVGEEGIYKLDYATLASMGINMETLNPNQIRIFGNEAGALPEKNSDARPDDLTEVAIMVVGAEDGRFDESDYVLFFGQEATCWTCEEENGGCYQRKRNYYSDVTHYYLCADSGLEGLRMGSQATLPVAEAVSVISDFNYVAWHEEELMSPYFSGQNWFGEMLSEANPVLEIVFDLPNLIVDKPIYFTSKVLGHVAQSKMHYDLWVNDNQVVNHASINSYGTGGYNFGSIHEVKNRQIALESDTAVCRLEIVPENNNANLYLDCFEISCWRRLKRVGNDFAFKIMPSQFGNGSTAIWIQDVDNNYQLWDVSDALHPCVQEGLLSGGNFVFASDQPADKRYHLFRPSAYRSIQSFEPLANQDVHAIADADMLIITPDVFREQAEQLAEMHREWDDMLCVVVDVNEISNEFATGTPDPTGIRDFIRMVYRRSANHLKYVTLFGKASADFKDIKGYGNNFVPTYETMKQPFLQEKSFCTDDYFVILNDNDGVNSGGMVSLGIGRLPVTTVAEADKVLNKIRHYHDLSVTNGDWKMNHLLMADDDLDSFFSQTETCGSIIDTVCHEMHQVKLYTDAYQQVSSVSGPRHPGAHDELMQRFDQGLLAMHYAGHAGYLGLTSEAVFTVSDIAEMTNYDRLPFLLTASCEFSVYDNPLKISAGEQMLLSDKGGAIALFTAPRPTQGAHNKILAKAWSKYVFSRENGQPLRFGDICRLAKTDMYDSPNVTYVLLGDPALRISMPQEEVKTLKINGSNLQEEIELHAMSMVNIEGEIRGTDGRIDQGFNGEVWVKLYDKESRFTTLGQESAGVHSYTFFNDVLYRGRASVTNGRFVVSFQVPADIKMNSGMARLSYYAYDSIRQVDAMGVYEGFSLGGVDPAMVHDNEGPQIKFYWNTPDFVDGDVVARNGALHAELYDAQGISHYDFSLGRNIMLSSNLMGYNNLNINDAFEPALDDFRRGTITLPIADLEPGTYEFGLKVWDTQDNPSEARLWFIVQDGIFLSHVYNYPNPFSDATYFNLAHDGDDGQYTVNIEIFDMMGRHIANLNQNVTSTGNVMEPIRWEGKDNHGNPLRTGVYLYRLSLTDEEGNTRTVSQRMVVSR